jgi:hypothetical protein
MASPAELQIIRRPLHHARMGQFLGFTRLVSPVAGRAPLRQMGIPSKEARIDEVTPVILFRLNWRRRPRSPFTFSADRRRFDQGLQLEIIRVAGDTTAVIGSPCPSRRQTENEE